MVLLIGGNKMLRSPCCDEGVFYDETIDKYRCDKCCTAHEDGKLIKTKWTKELLQRLVEAIRKEITPE